jgi:ATP-dependent helicase IRC3
LVLATGLGKTVIFSHLISQRHAESGKKALILAHREELLTQAKDKLEKIDSTLNVQIEQATNVANDEGDVIAASVQTIGRELSERINKLNPEEFDTIIIDEAHHASASTYKNILNHFGILKGENDTNKDILLLGVTATPSRADNAGIDKIFDEVVFNYGIIEGIRDGWLSRIKAFRVNTRTSLEDVHTIAGDFNQGELGDTLNNPERNDLVVKTYIDQFNGKQALVFAVDVEHAQALTEAFLDKHISAGCITGSMDKNDRHLILEAFHNKEIQVVVNCMVLTEGYDNDTIDVIMMARPTKSGILYQQMVGRGTRTHEEKPFLTICDFVDNTVKHTIKTSASLLGVLGIVDFKGKDILDCWEDIKKVQELAPNFNLDKLDFDRLDYIMEEVDLLGGLDIPTEIKESTENSWHRFGEDAYRIGIGDSRYFVIRKDMTEHYKATLEWYIASDKKTNITELGETSTLDEAIHRMDRYIENNYPEALRLVDMGAKWRKDKPSDLQIAALKRLGVDPMIIDQLNKGQASQLQSKLYSGKFRRRV